MSDCNNLEKQQALCKAWKQSGLTKTQFCIANKISRSCLYKWLAHFADADNSEKSTVVNVDSKIKNSQVKFIKIPPMRPSSVMVNLGELEFTLPNGVGIKTRLTQEQLSQLIGRLLIWK